MIGKILFIFFGFLWFISAFFVLYIMIKGLILAKKVEKMGEKWVKNAEKRLKNDEKSEKKGFF